MTRDVYPRLLADVGGTNARFAWQTNADATPGHVSTLSCHEHDSLLDAARQYLRMHDLPPARGAAFGVANPVLGDEVRMTNHHWSFSIRQLQRDLGVDRLAVVNDFQALALALPTLGRADLHAVGGGAAVPGTAMAVLGPGTGLGVSGLLPQAGAGGAVAITGEGGHVSLSAADAAEAQVIAWLHDTFGHASAERALSGPGLVNLYRAASAVSGHPAQALDPATVLARGRDGTDAACRRAIDLFLAFLGSVAGNLALTLGARGGVFIGGGIVPRLLDELPRSRLRERFDAKGRFRDYLAAIPIHVIDARVSPALVGASRALDLALSDAA